MDGCDYDEDGYEVLASYSCIPFSDGKAYWLLTDYKMYCSNLCEAGCKQESCDPAKDDDGCASDGTTIKECVPIDDEGNSIYIAYDCAYDGLACYVDEDGYPDCD